MKLENYENPTRTSTPLYTKDWYIKWVSSVILIAGMILAANNLYPYNVLVQLIGVFGWLIVALMWNDRALIVINAVGVAVLSNGLVGYLIDNGGKIG